MMGTGQFRVAVVTVFGLWAASAAPAGGKKLLRNGGFTDWADGKPAKWDLWGAPQKVSRDADAGRAAEGAAVRVDIVKADKGRYGQIRQGVAVQPDTWYRLDVDMRSSAAGVGFAEVKRIVGGKEAERIPTSHSTTRWTTHSKAFCSGEATKLDVGLRYRQGPDQVGRTVWFARARLVALPGPPEGIPGVSEVKAPMDISEHGPHAVPTFECVGLSWRTREGSSHNPCRVRYRAKGEDAWREAMDLWFDPNPYEAKRDSYHFGDDDRRSYEYRGSIVHLRPDTAYEVELALARSGTKRTLTFRTWSEQLQVKAEREVSRDGDTFEITEGGSAEDGYVVYTLPKGTVRTSANRDEPNVRVKAPYVILRGLRLVGGKHGIELGDVHHVVVEDCDISGWGRTAGPEGYGENLNAAVYSKSVKLEHIVVQRCALHHPASNSNSWMQERVRSDGGKTFHPMGPQGIAFRGGRGRYVIRHNHIHSDKEHMFNDGMGETRNFSFRGFPNRDSDIYGNRVSHCWDDALEIEGANINVRVWGNAVDRTYVALAAATTSQGPLYLWRNVAWRGWKGGGDDAESYKAGPLLKLGNENVRWVRGKIYVLHNTIHQPPARPGHKTTCGMRAGLICTGRTKRQWQITSRNNILHLRTDNGRAIYEPFKHPTNDFDHDMTNGQFHFASGQEAHVLRAAPVWEKAPDGRLWLKPGTPGHDRAVRLPNFNDGFLGAAPDMGAVETGSSREPRCVLAPPPPGAEEGRPIR